MRGAFQWPFVKSAGWRRPVGSTARGQPARNPSGNRHFGERKTRPTLAQTPECGMDYLSVTMTGAARPSPNASAALPSARAISMTPNELINASNSPGRTSP